MQCVAVAEQCTSLSRRLSDDIYILYPLPLFMARRRRGRKIQPSIETLHFRLVGSQQSGYIDLAESLSIANRRAMKQGMTYAIAGIQVFAGSSVTGRVLVEKLPTSWPVSNAWHKSFAMWKKQQDDVVRESGAQSAVAAFRDFKIYADATHATEHQGGKSNLLPQMSALLGSGGTTDPLVGEWQYSEIVIPNATADASGSLVEPVQRYLHMLGANDNGGISKGIVDGYAKSRSFPQSPDPVVPEGADGIVSFENWMSRMTNVGNDNPEILDNAVNTNDELPYDQEEYPGGEDQFPNLFLHDMIDITGDQNIQWSMKGGSVPCGLLKIYKENSTGSTPGPDGDDTPAKVLDVFIHMVPGHYRGYLAEAMQEL